MAEKFSAWTVVRSSLWAKSTGRDRLGEVASLSAPSSFPSRARHRRRASRACRCPRHRWLRRRHDPCLGTQQLYDAPDCLCDLAPVRRRGSRLERDSRLVGISLGQPSPWARTRRRGTGAGRGGTRGSSRPGRGGACSGGTGGPARPARESSRSGTWAHLTTHAFLSLLYSDVVGKPAHGELASRRNSFT